jgi:hypothetical protein
MRGYSGPLSAPVIIILTIIVVLLFVGVWAIGTAFGADNDPPCLTKAQAQAKYPGQWLYWRTERRCWYGQSTRTASRPATVGKQNSLKLPKPLADPNGNVMRHSGRPVVTEPTGPTVAYPTMMPGGGTSDDMLTPERLQTWPVIMDFDAEPPQFIPWQKRVASAF